jgi:hypothetical protein
MRSCSLLMTGPFASLARLVQDADLIEIGLLSECLPLLEFIPILSQGFMMLGQIESTLLRCLGLLNLLDFVANCCLTCESICLLCTLVFLSFLHCCCLMLGSMALFVCLLFYLHMLHIGFQSSTEFQCDPENLLALFYCLNETLLRVLFSSIFSHKQNLGDIITFSLLIINFLQEAILSLAHHNFILNNF